MPPPETCNETEIARGLGGKKIGSQFGDVILLQCSCLLPEASCDWGWKGKGREREHAGLDGGMQAGFVFQRGPASGACRFH